MSAGREGALYEQEVNAKLKRAKLQPPGFTHNPNDNAGVDAVFVKRRDVYGIEVKHTFATTYGSIGLLHNGKRWVISPPGDHDDPLLYDMLKRTAVERAANQLYHGRGIPHLFRDPAGRAAMTPEQALEDVERFRGAVIVDIPAASALKYYSSKKVDYFQIKDLGFYHVLDNPADVPCPKLKMNRLVAEIRMKTEKKASGAVYYRFVVAMKAAGMRPTKSPNNIDTDVKFLH